MVVRYRDEPINVFISCFFKVFRNISWDKFGYLSIRKGRCKHGILKWKHACACYDCRESRRGSFDDEAEDKQPHKSGHDGDDDLKKIFEEN